MSIRFPARRLVPVTPLRSQARKNCIIKVPLQNDNFKITTGEANAPKSGDNGTASSVNNIPLIAPPPASTDITKNLLAAANKPVTLLSANQV